MRRGLKLIVVAGSVLLWAGVAVADGEGQAPPPAAPVAADAPPAAGDGKPDMLADGGRLTLKDGDFTIQPPTGWEVYTHVPGQTLLAQVPHTPGMKYQRTIQVMSFEGRRYIDEVTAKEYEETIVRKFASASSTIEGYRVRNHMNVEMADGREGLLFYTEFTLDGTNLMQQHILVSSSARHYLLTFTDVAEHFESDAANKYLTEAWESMISVQLGSKTPVRFEAFAFMMGGVGALFLVALLVVGIRAWRSNRKHKMYAEGQGLDDVSSTPVSLVSGAAPLTIGSKAPTGKSNLSQFPDTTRSGPKTTEDQGKTTTEAEEPFDTQEDIAI